MDVDSSSASWLLLLAQLPSTPSSARVALWRRLRAIGATTMVNSAWVLPDTAAHADFFEQLRENITRLNGTGFVLNVSGLPPGVDETIVQRFRADRAREYDEFAERCAALLEEIGRETRAEKYTFAEMEESEQDLEKLARWLAKIQARDFFPDERRPQAAAMMARCRSALNGFSQAVYIAEGVQEVTDGVTQAPTALESTETGAESAVSPGREATALFRDPYRRRRSLRLDPARVNGEWPTRIWRRERFVSDQPAIERQAGRQPAHLELAKGPAGPGDPDRDLPSVGDQDLAHAALLLARSLVPPGTFWSCAYPRAWGTAPSLALPA